MLLQVLHQHAKSQGLLEKIAFTSRVVHLALVLRDDGQVDPASPWRVLGDEVEGKKGEKRFKLGRSLPLPRFPGENNGGRAYFLAEKPEAILGIDPATGRARPDVVAKGQERSLQNAVKAFHHFWQRIEEAHAATGSAALATLLAFRNRYLAGEAARNALLTGDSPPLILADVAKGRSKPAVKLCARSRLEPTPLESTVVTFEIDGLPVLDADPALVDYWNAAYARETFTTIGDEEGDDASTERRVGLCLVTGENNQPIAGSHKPEIKGVPGLPAKGGYLISFAREAPAFESYGLAGSLNAPVSDRAAASYALGLNDLLARDKPYARVINNEFVICSWVKDDPDLSLRVNCVPIQPDDDQSRKLFDDFEKGRLSKAILAEHFHSVTLAANGGRVVVRRWLDRPLGEVLVNLKRWFDRLDLEEVQRPAERSGRGRKSAKVDTLAPLGYRALDSLADTTARTSADVPSSVYDALYRAALEGEPLDALLPNVLNRLRIAATKFGANIRYDTSRFALIKYVLLSQKEPPMIVERHLCDTNDAPYNCGRLLALLDSMQYAAHGEEVGADVVARFYGNASTFPGNVFPRLLRLEKHHRSKALKSEKPKTRAAATAIGRRIDALTALFPPGGSLEFPQFPHLLTPIEQGRFALGFHQQKAADQRDIEARQAEKLAAGRADADDRDLDPEA